jgi:glycosyltransferase involved in cell wall biosynthesis
MPPKVSIITTTYNGEKYLEEFIDSMLGQTFCDFEFIIVDDGSTDSTVHMLQQIKDPRVRIFKQKNQGQVGALITGIKYAQGELIARIDQDDYSLPHRLLRQVEFMDANPKVSLCGSRWQELRSDTLTSQRAQFVQSDAEIKKVISYFNPFSHSAVMFRKESYFKIGGYDKSFLIAMDYDLYMRLMEVGEVYNIDEVLAVVRMHDESFSMKKSRMKILESIKIRSRAHSKFRGYPLLFGFFFLKSIVGLALPSWVKKKINI